MKKNKKLRAYLSAVMSFLMAVALFVFFTGALLQAGFLSARNARTIASSGKVVAGMTKAAEEEMEALALSAGLSQREWHYMIVGINFESDYRNYVIQMFDHGQAWDAGRETFEAAVQQGFDDYLTDNGIVSTGEMEADIASVQSRMMAAYQRFLQPAWIGAFLGFREARTLPIGIVMAVSAVIFAVLLALLWRMYHYKHRALRYGVYASSAAVIWNAALLLVMWLRSGVEAWGVGPKAYTDMIAGYMNQSLLLAAFVVAAELLVAAGLALLARRLKARGK